MSGSQAALTPQQIVTTGYQAWMPWQPLPENPPGLPNVNAGAGPSTDVYNRTSVLATILASWTPPDPLPTIPPFDALNIGLGASISVFASRVPTLSDILTSWQPPDPFPTVPKFFGSKIFTPSGPAIPPTPKPIPGGSVTPPHNVTTFGGVPVYLVPGVGGSAGAGAIFPAAALASSIAVGGTAVIVAIGALNGGYITNPANSTAQGIATAENIYIDMVKAPGSTDATANGTTVLLTPGQNFTIPAIASGVSVYVNAATSGHLLTVVVW